MSVTIDNGDGTYTVLAGHPAGIDAYLRAMERTESINRTSKFKINQRVRVKDDIYGIANVLMPTYRFKEAMRVAKELAGSEVQVIAPDKLTSPDDEWRTYYTVAMDDGCFHVLPEYLLEEC